MPGKAILQEPDQDRVHALIFIRNIQAGHFFTFEVTSHSYRHKSGRKAPTEWRPADCIPGWPWSAGNWKSGNTRLGVPGMSSGKARGLRLTLRATFDPGVHMRDHLLEHDVDPGAQVLELPLDGVKFLAQGLFADPGHGLHRRVGFHNHHRRLFIQLAGIIRQTPTHHRLHNRYASEFLPGKESTLD